MILLSNLVGIAYRGMTVYDCNSQLLARTYTNDLQFLKMIEETYPTAVVDAMYGTVSDRHISEIYVWTKQSKETLAKERIEYVRKLADITAEDDKDYERRWKDCEAKRLKRIAKTQQL